MDKIDLLIFGISKWAEQQGIFADYVGVPGTEDFEWKGGQPLPPEEELLALGSEEVLAQEKRAAIRTVVAEMERELRAIGVHSPYFVVADKALAGRAAPIIADSRTKIEAIDAAKTVDEVKAAIERVQGERV